nr:MAG TPA: hypothetical protein [Caudoviricetes sp.]
MATNCTEINLGFQGYLKAQAGFIFYIKILHI